MAGADYNAGTKGGAFDVRDMDNLVDALKILTVIPSNLMVQISKLRSLLLLLQPLRLRM